MLAFEYIYFLSYHRGVTHGVDNPKSFAAGPLIFGVIFLTFTFVIALNEFGDINLLAMARGIDPAVERVGRRSKEAFIVGIASWCLGVALTSYLFRKSFRERAISKFSPAQTVDLKRMLIIPLGFCVSGILFPISLLSHWYVINFLIVCFWFYVHRCGRSRLVKENG